MKEKTFKKWWLYVLAIPLIFIGDAIVSVLAVMLDSAVFADSDLGLVFLIIISVAVVIVTAILMDKAIYKAMAAFRMQHGKVAEGTPAEILSVLSLWQYWVPLPIQLVIFGLLSFISLKSEMDVFYANPDHIGHPLPLFSIWIIAFLAVVVLASLVYCLIYFIKAIKADEERRKAQ